MALSDHLTLKQPLGPINQSIISDVNDAAALLEGVPSFIAALQDRATIILGRRGAGKSSVLHGYRAQERFQTSFSESTPHRIQNRDLVLQFTQWEGFHRMAQSVGKELSAYLKINEDTDFLFTETTSEIWQTFIWDGIFTNIYSASRDGRLDDIEILQLKDVFEYFSLASIKSSDITTEASQALFMRAQSGLIEYLNNNNRTCHVLFDNIDEYPVRNPLIENVISGYLRAIHFINANFSKINIIVCIPEEIEAFLQNNASNVEKDFTATHKMRWRPLDLLHIVAYRYRRFIEIYDPAFFTAIRDLNFSRREDIIALFDRILPRTVRNNIGYDEPALAYIIRHTQLIPRHFIILFNRILTETYASTGGFRNIDPHAIINGVAEAERQVAEQILKPYRDLYPQLVNSAKLVLANLPPICGESDLDEVGTRFKDRVEKDVYDVWRKLYEIGILGMIENDDYVVQISDAQKYIYAHFHFNSNLGFGKTKRRRYCIHPIFSRHLGLTRGDDCPPLAIYPKNVPHDLK